MASIAYKLKYLRKIKTRIGESISNQNSAVVSLGDFTSYAAEVDALTSTMSDANFTWWADAPKLTDLISRYNGWKADLVTAGETVYSINRIIVFKGSRFSFGLDCSESQDSFNYHFFEKSMGTVTGVGTSYSASGTISNYGYAFWNTNSTHRISGNAICVMDNAQQILDEFTTIEHNFGEGL